MAFGPERNTVIARQAQEAVIDVGLRQYMLGVYNYMASGLALTGIVAAMVAMSPGLQQKIFGTPLMWVAILAPVALVFFLSFRVHKMSATAAQATFWIYAALNGIAFSTLFLVYTNESIARVFFITAADTRLTITDVGDEGWVEAWQRSLAPIPLGTRFVVLPHENLPAPASREPIRLIPGMAFGTGEHATTRLCAGVLEDLVVPGSRWLDLGCGTGILAIVAARLGASSVAALDLDPQAAQVAEEVVRCRVELRTRHKPDRRGPQRRRDIRRRGTPITPASISATLNVQKSRPDPPARATGPVGVELGVGFAEMPVHREAQHLASGRFAVREPAGIDSVTSESAGRSAAPS